MCTEQYSSENKIIVTFWINIQFSRENNTDTTSIDKPDDAEYLRMCKALSLAIAYSANCGGVASLTGTGPNVIMKGAADT